MSIVLPAAIVEWGMSTIYSALLKCPKGLCHDSFLVPHIAKGFADSDQMCVGCLQESATTLFDSTWSVM